MAKTVFATDMVSHVWAQRSQAEGRTAFPSDGGGRFGGGSSYTSGPRVWFRGDVLYSYQEPIARLIDGADGATYGLVTAGRPKGRTLADGFESWSISTGGHERTASHAMRSHVARTFRVPSVAGSPFIGGYFGGRPSERSWSYSGEAAPVDHALNLAHLEAAYSRTVNGLERGPKVERGYRPDWTPDYAAGESYGSDAGRLTIAETISARLASALEDARQYRAAFGLEALEGEALPLSIDADAERLTARHVRLWAAWNEPAAVAKREAAKAKGEATRENNERLRLAPFVERLAAWRAGGRADTLLRYGEREGEGGTALLRVKGKALETSQGASVPLAEAVKVFRFAKLIRARAVEVGERDTTGRVVAWKRNGATVPVGNFQLDRVYSDGSFKAGCHFIAWSEIVAAATQAGVLDLDADDSAVRHA